MLGQLSVPFDNRLNSDKLIIIIIVTELICRQLRFWANNQEVKDRNSTLIKIIIIIIIASIVCVWSVPTYLQRYLAATSRFSDAQMHQQLAKCHIIYIMWILYVQIRDWASLGVCCKGLKDQVEAHLVLLKK
jgi:hypothetical protein